MGQQGKPREAPPGPEAEEKESPARLGVGWRIAVIVWALAFGGLVLAELWDFFWKGVRGLF